MTPMCTQLTFEGLVDETLGVRNGSVTLDAAPGGVHACPAFVPERGAPLPLPCCHGVRRRACWFSHHGLSRCLQRPSMPGLPALKEALLMHTPFPAGSHGHRACTQPWSRWALHRGLPGARRGHCSHALRAQAAMRGGAMCGARRRREAAHRAQQLGRRVARPARPQLQCGRPRAGPAGQVHPVRLQDLQGARGCMLLSQGLGAPARLAEAGPS